MFLGASVIDIVSFLSSPWVLGILDLWVAMAAGSGLERATGRRTAVRARLYSTKQRYS
jgi:hypothetical protein